MIFLVLMKEKKKYLGIKPNKQKAFKQKLRELSSLYTQKTEGSYYSKESENPKTSQKEQKPQPMVSILGDFSFRHEKNLIDKLWLRVKKRRKITPEMPP